MNNSLIWELPLILAGIFFLARDQNKLFRKGVLLFLLALLPYFVFEKKYLSTTAFLTLPIILFTEVYAIKQLLINFKVHRRRSCQRSNHTGARLAFSP